MIFAFFLSSLIIGASTIGFGIFIKEVLNLRYKSAGLSGLLGLFLLSIISSYTHLILPHNFYHNIFFIILGLSLFFFYKVYNFSYIKNLIGIFALLFICLIISKNNEDFGYYHLPNSLQFAQQKLQFGIGNLNHGFKHISSLFQIMSLNYLPFFNVYLFNLTNFLFYYFLIIFFFENLFSKNLKISNINKFILLFFAILFLTKFSRLAEFGSDISGQIAIVVYLFYCLEIILNTLLNKKKKFEYFKLALIFLTFAITLKFILIIYSVIFILIIYLEKKTIFSFIKSLNIQFLLIIFLPSIIFVFLNFSSTGCLIYPLEKLCFTQLDWSLKSETVKYLNTHYEIWAKGGKGPGFEVNNPKEYINSLNWVENWFKAYFIGKFTDYLLVIILIIFSFYLVFFKQIKKNQKNSNFFNSKNLNLFFSFFVIFMVWFFNFPTLRYAGYIIIYIMFIFPFSVYISGILKFSSKENLNKFLFLIILSYSIFLFKNIDRISGELKIAKNFDHNFKDFPFFWIKNTDFKKIYINGHELYKVNSSCWNTKSTCIRNSENLKVFERNKYLFYKYE